eukprot:scpid106890/ scgid3158/ 
MVYCAVEDTQLSFCWSISLKVEVVRVHQSQHSPPKSSPDYPSFTYFNNPYKGTSPGMQGKVSDVNTNYPKKLERLVLGGKYCNQQQLCFPNNYKNIRLNGQKK